MRNRNWLGLTARVGACSLAAFLTLGAALLEAQTKGPADTAIRHVAGSEVEQLPDGSSGRIVEFRSSDGKYLPGYMRRPKGSGPFPVVVVLHGGAADKDVTYDYGRRTTPPTGDFVAAGWAVLAIDFRPDALFQEIELDDTAAAIDGARKLPFIDGRRVGTLGGSHGGWVMTRLAARLDISGAILCAPGAADAIELFKRQQAGEKISDILAHQIPDVERKYGAKMADIAKDPGRYGFRSVTTEVPKIRCPILIINGQNDMTSRISRMQTYVESLRAAGKQVETYFPADGVHGFYFGRPSITPQTQEAAGIAVAFLRKQFAR